MLLAICLILLICLFTWLRIKWVKLRGFWNKRGVPHNPPHPILGSLTFLQRENPTVWIRKLYNEFKTPYVGIWVFWRPGLVINDPELARKVLVKDADNFRDRFLGSGKTDPIGGLNLFTVNEPVWSNIRRRLTIAFTSAKLRAVEGIIKNKCQDLMERIQLETKTGPLEDIRKIFTDYTTDVTGEAAFGISCKTTKTGASVLRTVTEQFMQFNTFRGISWTSIFFFPSLVDYFGFSFFPKPTTEILRQVYRAIVEQRGGYDKPVTECKDFFDALLKLKQDAAKEGEDFSEDFLLAQAAIFLLGGFDTTGASLTWITYEMAHYPQYQDKIYEEIVEAKRKLDGGDFDSKILAEMPYLNAVIKESLRKYPPMGWLDRITASDYQLDETLTIPAGTVIYVNGTAMHMDPQYFPQPDTFDPERFLPHNEKNIVPYTYMPFGDGPRKCIGGRFAYQTIRFCLAELFLRYKLAPVAGYPLPKDIHVERKGIFYMPDESLALQFIPRQ